MNRSREVAALVLAGTLMLSGGLARNIAKRAWMRVNHAVVPHGSSTMRFVGKPGLILSVVGQRAGMEAVDSFGVAAYHILLTFPADSAQTVGGTAIGGSFEGGSTQEFALWSGGRMVASRALASEYDPVRGRARIAGRAFALSRGNLFVARYDPRGRLSIVQLPRTRISKEPITLLRTFQALLPGDRIVQELNHFPPNPCPRARAKAAGAAV